MISWLKLKQSCDEVRLNADFDTLFVALRERYEFESFTDKELINLKKDYESWIEDGQKDVTKKCRKSQEILFEAQEKGVYSIEKNVKKLIHEALSLRLRYHKSNVMFTFTIALLEINSVMFIRYAISFIFFSKSSNWLTSI